jgi:hypothetical protein
VRAFELGRVNLGVALFDLAVQKASGVTSRTKEIKRECISQLESAKAWPLLAGQCKVYLETAGKVSDDEWASIVLTRVTALAESKSTASLSVELDRALKDKRSGSQMPSLLLLKWRLLRQEHKGEEAVGIMKMFMREYPKDPRVAEMYYAIAVDCLASQRYEEARSVLEAIVERFPYALEATRAEELLKKLSITNSTFPTSTPKAP